MPDEQMTVIGTPPTTSPDPFGGFGAGSNVNILGGAPPNIRFVTEMVDGLYFNNLTPIVADKIKSDDSDEEKLELAMWYFRNCTFINMCMLSGDRGDAIDQLVRRFDTPERTQYKPENAPPQLSNSVYSIAAALSNFLWGNGRSMGVDISYLNLDKLDYHSINGFTERVDGLGEPGNHSIEFIFPYDTSNTSLTMPYILGNITLHLDGVFTRSSTGAWSFDGVVRAQTADLYDFNASTHRSKVNEDLTTIGRWMGERFSGKPYKIEINGEVHVTF